jgi:hypothetical protein
MRFLLTVALISISFLSSAQNVIDWDGVYELQISDFQSSASQIGDVDVLSFSSGTSYDFAFQMTSGEFMFTKNFNSKVACSFKRDQSVLVAPDSARANDLVAFARYEFDLCELYARKFRKSLYEEKGAFSDASFFAPIFEASQKEYAERRTAAARETDLGTNRDKLEELRKQVRKEIETLPDFCKACKPPKKKN